MQTQSLFHIKFSVFLNRMARNLHRFGVNMWVGIFGTALIRHFLLLLLQKSITIPHWSTICKKSQKTYPLQKLVTVSFNKMVNPHINKVIVVCNLLGILPGISLDISLIGLQLTGTSYQRPYSRSLTISSSSNHRQISSFFAESLAVLG